MKEEYIRYLHETISKTVSTNYFLSLDIRDYLYQSDEDRMTKLIISSNQITIDHYKQLIERPTQYFYEKSIEYGFDVLSFESYQRDKKINEIINDIV